MSLLPVEEWKQGYTIRCVRPYPKLLTQGKLYTLLSDTKYDGLPVSFYARVMSDNSNIIQFIANRFICVSEAHKEFTDEEYESLLI